MEPDWFEVEQGQHVSWISNTRITCKKGASFSEPCLIASDFTWDKQRETKRIDLVRGEEGGRQCWYYVFLHAEEEIQEQYRTKMKTGSLKLSDYGKVFKSGWGKDPPEKLEQDIAGRCDRTKHTYY